jgi:hypothetical protein
VRADAILAPSLCPRYLRPLVTHTHVHTSMHSAQHARR